MWLSLVERCVRDAEAAGSNPVISTTRQGLEPIRAPGFYFAQNVVPAPERYLFISTRQQKRPAEWL